MRRYRVGLVFLLAFLLALSAAAAQSQPADLVIRGGVVYTVDSRGSTAEAVAVRNGRIAAVGSGREITPWIGAGTRVIDATGLAVYPGFIDSHAHLIGMGSAQRSLHLGDVTSYDELVARVAARAEELAPGEWILGRGWHQSKWASRPVPEVRGFPTHDALSAVSPENPVFLTHASGHAALANARAMTIAGIDAASRDPQGGEIVRNAAGAPTGVLVEAASSLVGRHVPLTEPAYQERLLESAIQECLENGITTVHDAGSGRVAVAAYQRLLDSGRLRLRVNVMLAAEGEELVGEWLRRGPLIGAGGGFLTIRAFKIFVDGALGSRGAWLSAPYADDPGNSGQVFPTMPVLEDFAARALASGFQVATHAIGDRANHEVLNVYERVLRADARHARFRIEHAQHIREADVARFAELGVIASMQGIHMASDISWAIDRLGPARIAEGAYVWRKLLDAGAIVANGTDAPVEPIDPIACFYASVTRRTREGRLLDWAHPVQAMTRAEALRSYTASAAYAGFEEDTKGSIEVGKVADLTILSQDIMTAPEETIPNTKVVYTIVDGKVAYASP
jgi:predicted amidohydrolase YtcJ